MPLLDEDESWKFHVFNQCFNVAVSLTMGILALVWMGADKGDCGDEPGILLLAVGILYIINAVFSLCLCGLWGGTRDAAKAGQLGALPAICQCCAGIALFVFIILGSVWIFGESSSDCQDSDLWKNANTFMIIWWILFGVGCFIGYCCMFAITGGVAYKAGTQ